MAWGTRLGALSLASDGTNFHTASAWADPTACFASNGTASSALACSAAPLAVFTACCWDSACSVAFLAFLAACLAACLAASLTACLAAIAAASDADFFRNVFETWNVPSRAKATWS